MTLGLSLSPEIQMFSEVFKGVPMGRSGLMIPAYKNTLPNTHTHTQNTTQLHQHVNEMTFMI